MVLSLDRWLAFIVTMGNGVLGAWWGSLSQSSFKAASLAVLLSIPGLAVIWFRESLQDSELAFPRGIRRASPPALLALVGWILLLLVPAFYIYRLSGHF